MISSPAPIAGLPRTFLMRATDALASATATYAIPLLVLVTTGSTALTGLAFLLEWAPRLAAFSFAGSMVDRWGAGRVFRQSNLVRTAVVTLAGAVLLVLPGAGTTTTCVVLAFGAVSGLLAEVSFVAVETLGAETSRRLGNAAHRVQAAQTGIDQGAMLVGPLLGGLLLLASPTLLLTAVALLALTAAVTTSGDIGATGHSPEPSSLLTGWATLRRTPALAWLVGGLAASNLATGVLQAAAPITVIHHFHYSTVAVGSVWSAAAVASLIAVWISRRAIDRFSIWPVGAVTAAVSTTACLATALAPSFATYTVAVAAVMAGEGAMTVVLRTLRSRLIPAQAFGSTLAVTIILVLLPLPLAGVLIALVPPAGIPHLLLACAALQGLALSACFAGLRRHRAACDLPHPQVSPLRKEPAPAADAV
ncbi:MFS transporter [Streptomyces sp. MBT56]|uniref:MFS transporter n=1 Tax=unclassified Streptomyces TaxID=2593676 RepID=UPI001909CBDB|nr:MULTISPECIES: MFS transporter [unclassified Streptomyces]MBK3534787.1 MFS transporter [Streptomyces sp. MBT67]MBK3560382.1 MFS transporter [Streptomyces sp. MBT56]MBK3600047.1 MFS transporter [Streptomyces sp. MBT54]MBK3613302.1 MFS transporter [Streptomyces sp. MBT98]